LRKYIVVCRDALQSILVFYRLYDAEPKSRRLFQAPRFGIVIITQTMAWGGSRCPVIRTKTNAEGVRFLLGYSKEYPYLFFIIH